MLNIREPERKSFTVDLKPKRKLDVHAFTYGLAPCFLSPARVATCRRSIAPCPPRNQLPPHPATGLQRRPASVKDTCAGRLTRSFGSAPSRPRAKRDADHPDIASWLVSRAVYASEIRQEDLSGIICDRQAKTEAEFEHVLLYSMDQFRLLCLLASDS